MFKEKRSVNKGFYCSFEFLQYFDGRASLYRIFDDLIKNQIILPTRTIGKSKLYRLNAENPKIKKLIQIGDLLILEELRKKAEKQKIKVMV